jgi:antitoxin YefM
MNQITKYVSIAKAKTNLQKLIRQVEHADEAVAVTKNGVPAAIILSLDKFQGLLETIEILSDKATMKSLKTSVRQSQLGKWVGHSEVFSR